MLDPGSLHNIKANGNVGDSCYTAPCLRCQTPTCNGNSGTARLYTIDRMEENDAFHPLMITRRTAHTDDDPLGLLRFIYLLLLLIITF